MSAHTPGPWLISEDGAVVTVRGATGEPIAELWLGGPIEQDARLIAAAPELLEALEWLVDILPDPELDNDELQRVWTKKARAAIAKATGAKP